MDTFVLIGRILFGSAFIVLGLNNFLRLEEKTAAARAKKFPLPKLCVIGSTVMFTLGGLGILLGYQVQLAVGLIAVFLVTITPVMHNFWAFEEPVARQNQMIHLLKNLAMLGAALMFLGLASPWANSWGG